MKCCLCELLSEKNNHTLIYKLNHGNLYLNYNQVFHGRVLYVYKSHVQDFAEINLSELLEADVEILAITKAIKRIFRADLMNIASLGNHVQHLHWHIIPRYKDDSNWGNPPWPHVKKLLNEAELRQMCNYIKEKLSLNEDFTALNINI